MIIENGPVPDNPFGHGAAANRYGLMSSGTGDKIGSSVTDYFKKMQPRRNSWVWIVDTTDEQEKCMINKAKDIEKSQEKLGIALDNCFSRTNQIFEACGYSNPVMNTNSPISIQVLGELYGTHKYVLEKGPFTKLPFEFQVEGK